jgi:hypothetical protein
VYINASLIRELRMMYQHAHTALSGGSGPRGRTAKPMTSLLCLPCLRRHKNRAAIAVYDGETVCRDHLHI